AAFRAPYRHPPARAAMIYLSPRQRKAQKEFQVARSQVVAFLTERLGPTLDAGTAERLVVEAEGWSQQPVRLLAAHLADHPDTLTSPSPHAPTPLVRLLALLHRAGHDQVARVACVVCGRAEPLPLKMTERGRCCGWCYARTRFRRCGRCDRVDQIVTS